MGLYPIFRCVVVEEDSYERESLWGEITGDNDETWRPSEAGHVLKLLAAVVEVLGLLFLVHCHFSEQPGITRMSTWPESML